MDRYLDAFWAFLFELSYGEDNMVLGGLNALVSHGLIVGRGCQDLDIILYNPSDRQIDLIRGTSYNGQQITREESEYPEKEEKRRSYKFGKDGLTIDILLEYSVEKPNGLLFYPYRNNGMPYFFEVQSVSGVIDAKRKYARAKDHKDFENFKRQNFNK